MSKKKFLQSNLVSISVLSALLVVFIINNNQVEAAVINKTSDLNSLRNGLVGWWTFDGANVTATTVTDKSGGGLNGTRNGTLRAAGKIGQALKFNGTSSDYITLPATGDFNVRGNMGRLSSENWSLSAWYKGTDLRQNVDYGVSLIGWNSGNLFASFSVRSGYAEFAHYNGGWQHNIKSATLVADGKWHLITYSNYSDNTGSLYIDGILEIDRASSTIGSGSFFQPYHIGANFNNIYTIGTIDDARIYNRSLSSVEVTQLYKTGGGKINKTDAIRAQLREGLKAHWTFDGADMTPNTSTDKSGQGNHGTRTGVTTMVRGKVGQAMEFNGATGSDIVVTTSASLNPATAMTVSAWVKTTDSTGIIINKDDGGSNRQYSLLTNSGVQFFAFQSGATYTNTAAIGISDGKWHFVVGTVDVNGDGKARMYIDGVLRDTGAVAITSIASSSVPATIGDRPTNAFPLSGTIDDARIYNRALSHAEAAELYKMANNKTSKTDTVRVQPKNSLVGHWTFDGGNMTSVTSTDTSGQGNHGTSTIISATRGKIGQGLDFKDTNYFINLGDPSSLRLTTQFTVSSWVKVRAHKNYNQVFMKNDANSDFYGLLLDANGKLTGQVGNGGSNVTLVGNTVLSAGKWYHVAATYNSALASGNLKLYINGVEDTYVGNGNFSSGVGDTAGGYTNIAKDPVNGRNFDGLLDDVRVYSRPLAPAEIMALYKTGK
ncbi:MAG: LamG domain-containing protein [Candidatus Magasanikbacteria bacterium]|nr:LamG domain-containing protein [Candidatus Magasanikbacteria bacterium]